MIYKGFNILAAQNFPRLRLNHFRDMGRQDRRSIHHHPPVKLCLFPIDRINPYGIKSEGRFFGRDPRYGVILKSIAHGHKVVRQKFTGC